MFATFLITVLWICGRNVKIKKITIRIVDNETYHLVYWKLLFIVLSLSIEKNNFFKCDRR